MIEKLIDRENEIFDMIKKFSEANLKFIVIGGYAVSAFKHRFSMDADIVISSKDLEKYESILNENGFKKVLSKDLENVYKSKFIRYKKRGEFSVDVDLLVDGLAVRQTGASYSFKFLLENSKRMKVIGTEKEIKVTIPKKEVLIALKIQSGRLTDFRDVVALSKDADTKYIQKLLHGDKRSIREHLNKLRSLIDKKDFINSFKGVFMEKKFDVDLEKVKEICDINV